MNHIFAEHTTSVAFAIQLSKNQCNALLRVDAYFASDRTQPGLMFVTVGTLKPLDSRGLVFWHRDESGTPTEFGGLTGAGMLMVGLLKEAGLTIENTNTVGMLRRIERETV